MQRDADALMRLVTMGPVPFRSTRGGKQRSASGGKCGVNGQLVTGSNSCRRMHDDGVADARTFRVQRFLNSEGPYVRSAQNCFAISRIGLKGKSQTGLPAAVIDRDGR